MKELAYDSIKVGDSASFSKTVTESDIVSYAGIVGDFNPVHINAEYAKTSLFKGRVAHGMISAGFISAVLGTQLPGPNSIYLGQELSFKKPVRIGDTLTATATISDKRDEKRIITLKTVVTNQNGDVVTDGKAVVKKVGL